MYQACIRDKKKLKHFNHLRNNNYEINELYEELAYVSKLLGNCRLQLTTENGKDVVGIIRGKLRKFNTRVVIEVGDIVVISKRDFQENKVDIVHKYNGEQVQLLLNEGKISTILSNLLSTSNNKHDNNDNISFSNDKSDTDYKSDSSLSEIDEI